MNLGSIVSISNNTPCIYFLLEKSILDLDLYFRDAPIYYLIDFMALSTALSIHHLDLNSELVYAMLDAPYFLQRLLHINQ